MNSYSIDIVVPCYNEEEALPTNLKIILDYLRGIASSADNAAYAFHVILVDDGSSDRTWTLICEGAAQYTEVRGLRLSRNYGHQTAILAGMTHSMADAVITMDADLQDDINIISKMIAEFEHGKDIVLGVRSQRKADTFLKRNTAKTYYRLLSRMGAPIVENHADFRLLSRRAVDALLQYKETNLFLRSLVQTVGFEVSVVEYVRQQRELGETKYTPAKMMLLAIDGITSFSVVPLRLITVAGIVIFAASILGLALIIFVRVAFPSQTLPGWASTLLPVIFFGGIQLMSLGVIGEYIGKIYFETKKRPRFFIQDAIGSEFQDDATPESAAYRKAGAGSAEILVSRTHR